MDYCLPPSLSSNEFMLMQKFIEDKCGIAICRDKSYLIESRLSKLLIDSGLSSFEEFFISISSGNDCAVIEKVIDAITTNETLWFRDNSPWSILENVLLPFYINELRDGRKGRVRIWSSACSTGQEPYSIAMCIHNYLIRQNIADIKLYHFEIIASDISKTVLEIAEAGRYDSISIMRGLNDEYKNRYFSNEGRVWIISEKIRNAVTFRQFNLQDDFSALGVFDIIFCRYVIIYFSEQLRKEVLSKTAQAMDKNGALFIGSSELITDYWNGFLMEQYKNGVFYRRKG